MNISPIGGHFPKKCDTTGMNTFSGGHAMNNTEALPAQDDINYYNVVKVLDKILTRYEVSRSDQAELYGVSTTQHNRLQKKQGNIGKDNQKRMAYLLNIHEQLMLLHRNEENRKIFLNEKNENPIFCGKSPLQHMLDEGLIGIYQTYTYLASSRGGGW